MHTMYNIYKIHYENCRIRWKRKSVFFFCSRCCFDDRIDGTRHFHPKCQCFAMQVCVCVCVAISSTMPCHAKCNVFILFRLNRINGLEKFFWLWKCFWLPFGSKFLLLLSAYCCCWLNARNLGLDICMYKCMSVTVCVLIFSVFRKQPAIYDVYILARHEYECAHARTHATNHLKRLMNMHESFTLLICH